MTASAGYDAATLHSYSLLTPTASNRIRRELADILHTDNGRYAELVVITELLHTTRDGDNFELAQPLRQRATGLLGPSLPPQ